MCDTAGSVCAAFSFVGGGDTIRYRTIFIFWSSMDFTTYQKTSRTTVQYPDAGRNIVYPTLGLAGEAGEVAEKVKKIIRDDGGVISDVKRAAIVRELGDVLWYVAQIATELDVSLDDVAQQNIDKLFSRRDRNMIGGSGDER